MASIKWDSELMTNYTEAINVPSGKRFCACVDGSTKQPAVFALSNHEVPKLQLIMIDSSGQRTLINLSELLGIASGSIIEAFDVRQGDDYTIYLSFSVKRGDGKSDLWVICPFNLQDTLSLQVLPTRPVGRVHNIVIGPVESDYPAIYLMHEPLSRTAKNSDLAQVRVYLSEEEWEIRNELTLPVNVEKILDIAPAFAGFFGHGLLYLCEHHGKRSLYAVFVRRGEELGDRGTASQFHIACPQDALSIETFVDYMDDDKRSSLLIGCGSGVRYIRSEELTSSSGITPITINNGDVLAGARDMYVSQTETQVSLFAFNDQDELTFLNAKIDDLENARAAPILPSGVATSFAALISPSDDNFQHSLVCNNDGGDLALLRQALDTGIWRHEPFYVETGGQITPFESWTVTITAVDSQEHPVFNGKIKLKASSSLPVIINGRTVMLNPAGSWHLLDNAGELGLIIPTKTITSQPITIQGLRSFDRKLLELPEVIIDPARKVLSRMSSLDSEESLVNAKTSDGQSLWGDGPKPSQNDMKNASKCFAAIKDAYQTLPTDGSIIKRSGMQSATMSAPQKTGNLFMDAFLWLRHKAHEVKEWVVRKAGQVWEFVCDIGGKVVNFVLDCVEKVTEAASWVWEKLKVGWDKLCNFVGFMFNWGDVLQTKDTIVGFINAGFDTAANTVEGLNSKVHSLFSDIQRTVANVTANTAKSDLFQKMDSKKKATSAGENDLQNSAPAKWVGERMKNGNARNTSAAQSSSDTGDKQDAELVDLWNDRIEPLLASFSALCEDLSNDIMALFNGDKDIPQETLITRIGSNFLLNVLEVWKKHLQAFISSIAKIVLAVKGTANASFEKGFLTSLYGEIAKGKDLTRLEAVALLIAIPSTFIIKLVTSAKPPIFTKIDSNFVQQVIAAKIGGSTISDAGPVSQQTLKDISTTITGCRCGAAVVNIYVKNAKLLDKITKGGLSVAVGSMASSQLMSIFADVFELYRDIIASPAEADSPGKDLIDIAIAVKGLRLVINALYLVVQKRRTRPDEATDQVMSCIDMLAGITNYLLYTAVYAIQLRDTQWKHYDVEIILTAAANNYLENLAAIGYFTASTFKEKNPPVSVIGVACCQIASWGGIGTKTAEFHAIYKKL